MGKGEGVDVEVAVAVEMGGVVTCSVPGVDWLLRMAADAATTAPRSARRRIPRESVATDLCGNPCCGGADLKTCDSLDVDPLDRSPSSTTAAGDRCSSDSLRSLRRLSA
jgi:hypothetical protein